MVLINKLPNFDLAKFSKIRCFWALGNPGSKFQKTRHNAGMLLLEYFVEMLNLSFISHKNFEYAQYTALSGKDFFFVRSLTFMNNSGDIYSDLVKTLKIQPSEILLLHDELEKEFGKYGFGIGSSKGHNGLKSIFERVDQSLLWRLKIGIGKPKDQSLVPSYVLAKFSLQELLNLNSFFEDFLFFCKKELF